MYLALLSPKDRFLDLSIKFPDQRIAMLGKWKNNVTYAYPNIEGRISNTKLLKDEYVNIKLNKSTFLEN